MVILVSNVVAVIALIIQTDLTLPVLIHSHINSGPSEGHAVISRSFTRSRSHFQVTEGCFSSFTVSAVVLCGYFRPPPISINFIFLPLPRMSDFLRNSR